MTPEEASRDHPARPTTKQLSPPSPPFGFSFLSLAPHPFLCCSLVNPAEAEAWSMPRMALSLSCVSGQNVLSLEGQESTPSQRALDPEEGLHGWS